MNNSKKKNTEIDDELLEYYEEDKKNPPFILLFLFTAVAVLFALGLSFSTISFLENNETINTIISKIIGDEDDDKDKYVITYAENTGLYESGINLDNQFPISDLQGKSFTGKNYVYTFSLVIGEKTKGAYYEITAIENNNNNLNPEFVKLYLTKNTHEVPFSLRKNGKVKTFNEYQKSEYNEATGKVIYSSYITEEEAKAGKINFEMRMWVSEDAIVDENFSNKTFGVKVNTYAAFLNR